MGDGVVVTPIEVLIVAFGVVPAASLVLLLAHFDVAFEPALIAPLL